MTVTWRALTSTLTIDSHKNKQKDTLTTKKTIKRDDSKWDRRGVFWVWQVANTRTSLGDGDSLGSIDGLHFFLFMSVMNYT